MTRRRPRRRPATPASPSNDRRRAPLGTPGFLGLIMITAVAAIGLIAIWQRKPSLTMERNPDRNVLLVSIDTLRADVLSSYGGRAQTPHIDALAGHGARFTFAHSHAVVTLPSHTTLLTGLYPFRHGVRDNNGYRVKRGQATTATRLKSLGFATGGFVGAFPLDARFGLNTGFDVYDDRIGEMGTTVDFALPDRRADAVVTPAMAWIDAQRNKWFAFVHVFDPHAPYQAPQEFATRYPSDPYAAEVAWTDHALGPLLDSLARQPRPTLVILTADHGESLGEHGELTHGIFAYESTLRVPLIVAEIDPARRSPPAGETIATAVRHIDVLPTILDAVGAPVDSTLPGSSLAPIIANGGGDDRPMYFEAMTANLSRGWAPLRGVLIDRDKYIDLPVEELYGLREDAKEQSNRAFQRRDRVEVLLNLLRGYDMALPDRPGEETSAVRDRLRALGYVGGSPASVRAVYTEGDDPKTLIGVDAMLHRAGELFELGKPVESAALFKEVITRRPETADAYRYLAFVYWESGRPADAIATLEQALRSGVTHRDVRVKLGLYLSQFGSPARAIKLLEGLAEDDTEALNALGVAYGEAGRAEDAMRTFRRVLDLDATNGLAYQNIATLQLKAGQRQAAESSLRKALQIDDTLHGAYTTLGVVLSETGRKADAVDMWQRALAREDSDYDALYNLTVTLAELGRRDEARTYGQRYIASAPPALYRADIERVRRLIESR
jgi:arylsulfatase A-like enzyme/Tfp pilus assembly protein PilF